MILAKVNTNITFQFKIVFGAFLNCQAIFLLPLITSTPLTVIGSISWTHLTYFSPVPVTTIAVRKFYSVVGRPL